MKTNYVPALCEIAKAIGCYAEVVSEMELDLAINLGFEHIIFNGPIKKESALQKAISHRAIVNLDSEYVKESRDKNSFFAWTYFLLGQSSEKLSGDY